MTHAGVAITLSMLTIVAVPAAMFLIRAVPSRRTHPALWQNGLWFILAFLVSLLLPFVNIVLLPVMLVTALVTAFVPSAAAKRVLFLALGEIAGTALGVLWIGLLSYYAQP